MDLNIDNNQQPQLNNGGVNNNQNPMNAALGGNAGKGCFGMSKLGCAGIAAIAALIIWGIVSYNGFVKQEQNVKESWSQVENQYQRRADLIKNVAASVKAYAKHEQGTFKDVTNARARTNQQVDDQISNQMQAVEASADSLMNVKVDPNNKASMQNFINAQDKITEQARLAINVVHEAYPELKASELFKDMQTQLEGSENRVSVARKDFLQKAKEYNTAIKVVPGVIIAKICGFQERPYFEAQEGADKAPDVGSILND